MDPSLVFGALITGLVLLNLSVTFTIAAKLSRHIGECEGLRTRGPV